MKKATLLYVQYYRTVWTYKLVKGITNPTEKVPSTYLPYCSDLVTCVKPFHQLLQKLEKMYICVCPFNTKMRFCDGQLTLSRYDSDTVTWLYLKQIKSRGPVLCVRSSETCSVCVKQALNTRRWLLNALVTWHVSYKITTLTNNF